MAEQTHGTKQDRAQEKYLTELRESEAYRLLRFAFLRGLTAKMPEFNDIVANFLDTGIIESDTYTREHILNGR